MTATAYGGALKALDQTFTQLERAGFDPATLSNQTVANVVAAGANGLSIDFNSKTGVLSASHSVTGSLIPVKVEIGRLGGVIHERSWLVNHLAYSFIAVFLIFIRATDPFAISSVAALLLFGSILVRLSKK